jgi:hypothetical protein
MSISATKESVLSGGAFRKRRDLLVQLGHVAVSAQTSELLDERLLQLLARDRDRGKAIGAFGCSVLELASLQEEQVDDDTLGRCEQYLLDERLVLVSPRGSSLTRGRRRCARPRSKCHRALAAARDWQAANSPARPASNALGSPA